MSSDAIEGFYRKEELHLPSLRLCSKDLVETIISLRLRTKLSSLSITE